MDLTRAVGVLIVSFKSLVTVSRPPSHLGCWEGKGKALLTLPRANPGWPWLHATYEDVYRVTIR